MVVETLRRHSRSDVPSAARFAEAAFGYASRQNAASGAKGRTDHVHRHRPLRNAGLTLFTPLRS
jgi:hypothetical protein